MELAGVLRWPIRSRNGYHDCKRCKRRLSWEWVWRCVSIKEEHRTLQIPIILERHKQQDFYLCKLCTPKRENAQFYVLSKGWEKKEKPLEIGLDVAYGNINKQYGGKITAGAIEAQHITAGVVSQNYASSGIMPCCFPREYIQTVDYMHPYGTTGDKVSVHPTGGSQPETHRMTITELDGSVHKHEFPSETEMRLYFEMMDKKVKKKTMTGTSSTGPR